MILPNHLARPFIQARGIMDLGTSKAKENTTGQPGPKHRPVTFLEATLEFHSASLRLDLTHPQTAQFFGENFFDPPCGGRYKMEGPCHDVPGRVTS
jgi:hypothetical protein